MIRILYMIDYLDWGGSENHLYDLVTHLDPGRFEPHIVYFKGGDVSRRLESRGFRTWQAGIHRINSLNALARLPELIGYIRKNRIQIVHTLHLKADIYGTLLGRMARVPVIISSRRDTGFTRQRNHIIFQNIFVDRFLTAVVVNSRAVMEAVCSRERIPETKIRLIYNGIELEELLRSRDQGRALRAELGFKEGDIVLGTLATFNPVKRYDLILKAANIVKDTPGAENVKFLLVGDGVTRPDMERQCRREGLNSRVVFAGHRDDIHRFLSAMDIFVNFSDSEGFSNAILQAMTVGLPVVASSAGGNPEIVTDRENGYLVEPGRYEDLAGKILLLAGDPDLRGLISERNREKVLNHFGIDRMIREFESLYENLLHGAA